MWFFILVGAIACGIVLPRINEIFSEDQNNPNPPPIKFLSWIGFFGFIGLYYIYIFYVYESPLVHVSDEAARLVRLLERGEASSTEEVYWNLKMISDGDHYYMPESDDYDDDYY